MLDLQFICEHQDEIAENCKNRGVSVDLPRIAELARKRSDLIRSRDDTKHEQNETSSRIKSVSADERPALIARGKELKEQVAQFDTELKEVETELREEQSRVPNMTHPDAPIGRTEEESVTLRTWGERPEFDFPAKDHVDLAAQHDLIDFEAGSRVAGHGFYYLKNEAALLELALVQFAVQTVRAAGFTIHITPDLARDEILEGIGFIPRGEETQIYSVEGSNLSLVATAEITLGGALRDQVLSADQLPLAWAGVSHCFRTEAGAHGRATRGIYRVHQFTKVEMFGFTLPDQSEEFHDRIVAVEESIFQALGLPYRVIDTCTGDLGGSAYRKFDLEAWMPGRGEGGAWGEVTSASNCTDYQSRRLGIRYSRSGEKGTRFVHTLNGTAVAVSRALIAILENYQQADGSIVIPEVLRPGVGQDRIG